MSDRKTKRNSEIKKLVETTDLSYSKIARLYGITKQRVAQIYHAERNREQDNKTG